MTEKLLKQADEYKKSKFSQDAALCGLGWINDLIKALADEVRGKEWRDIATAPKTSKSILVHCSDRQNTYCVSWGKKNGFLGGEGWRMFGGNNDLDYEEPTHWQPLPQPPKENK